MKVAFIGLGRMGRAMAGRLVGSCDLVAYNRTPGRGGELEQAGATLADSVARACDDRDVVITMLADDAALSEVTLCQGGIRDSIRPGTVHLVMGTHGVGTVQQLAGEHQRSDQVLVAAPVLGRPEVAAAGELGIVVAGPPDSVTKCEPLLALIGSRTFHAGPMPASASSVKLANNFVLGCAIEAMSEAFSLVDKYGVDAKLFHEVMVGGLFAAPSYRVYGAMMVEEDYDHVGFTVDLGLKDVNLILSAAELAHTPLPSANVYRDRLLGAIAHGDGERDWAVIAREQRRASGLP
jgi:3-hydroxyisobutyrate dehydrogenase-like beta-hydroxyacid dehydrogenase